VRNTPLPFRRGEAAILALEDGSIFRGVSIGAPAPAVGEVVFNTSMTGYQEILTDPSYSHQIVTLTYPHVGNTGVNPDDVEAARAHAAALVIRDLPPAPSNFRATLPLDEYLRRENVTCLAGIDTRRLTRLLRRKGAMGGAIVTGDDAARAVALARAFPGLVGLDLARIVSTPAPYEWVESGWRFDRGDGRGGYGSVAGASGLRVVAYDFGVKRNILRMLVERGCHLTVVPAQTPAEEVLRYRPDGIFLSNGPGDPEACTYAISAVRSLVDVGLPMFGICLGHQLLALASGARSLKMAFGHHGANHPVLDLRTRQVFITSQNHGFAVDAQSLPRNCRATHVSLFDRSLQGLERLDRPAFSFQGHPEASPGPQDMDRLFDRFTALMKEHQHAQAH